MASKERYKGKWLVLEDDMWTHIMPENDILPHSTDTTSKERDLAGVDCPCNPKATADGRLIHNSFQDKQFLDETLGF